MKRKVRWDRKNVYIIMFIVLAIIFIQVGLHILSSQKDNTLVSHNGTLDLLEWKESQYNLKTLSGEWEFYWDKILSNKDLKTIELPYSIVKIPSVWNDYEVNNKKLPAYGHATFRLHVINVEKGKTIAMRLPTLSTSYKLFIDDELKAQNGIVGTNKETASPKYKIQVFEFTPQSDSFDIIIQVSNYTYSRGGVWFAPQFGTAKDIYQVDRTTFYRDIFLFGCFFIMLIHSISIYLLRHKEKSYFYFALMCISIIGRISVHSSYIITYFSALDNLNVIVRLDYISLSWLSVGYVMLSGSQFPDLIPERIRKLLYIYTITFSGFVLITPIHIFTCFVYVMELAWVITASYTVMKLCKAYLLGQKKAIVLIITSGFFFICAIHDLLLQNSYISGSAIEYIPIGFFAFMFCEDFILAIKYTRTIRENELALEQIEAISKKEREVELKFLKSQIKPHFIHNALNAIIAISKTEPERSGDLLVEFSQYLRSCFDFENLEDTVLIEREINFIHSYLAIEKARFGDTLKIEYEIDNLKILIPPLILQPLVENAVLHGVRKKVGGGKITVYVKNTDHAVRIGVKDDGVGIPPDRIKDLLNGTSNSQGVGLYNINQRLNKIYHTSLIIENNETGGSNIYMNLPLVMDEG